MNELEIAKVSTEAGLNSYLQLNNTQFFSKNDTFYWGLNALSEGQNI